MGVREVVLAALDGDDPRERTAIVEDTALTEKQVGNALNNLKNAGMAKRVADGWIRTATASAKAAEPAPPITDVKLAAKPKAKLTKRAPKVNAKALKPIKARAVAVAGNASIGFVLTERMELGIELPNGRGVLTSIEALRLHDFLTLVRPALEGSR